VLGNPVRQALDMALSHARHSDQLMVKWGLREIIPYGHSPVLLFSGQPGTGKTAAAEAFAHELGKPILVADYSRIQNCFVGQTEKNIIKAFRAAQRQKAVLFWDEADAMFYDRDSARQNWEVRDVNVLLQELERFEGVCILATNRKITLDKALERRITLKVEFDRPDRQQRQGIWKKMLPTKMPLSEDVNLDSLSEADFVGGEIKNVVLNAARLAVQRGCEQVGMKDFQKAITMEQKGRWNGQSRRRVGFSG
jgi:SpoVK/Ycf46/Vps4 family AAA+-type ATPase